METGTIRRLGADVIEYAVRARRRDHRPPRARPRPAARGAGQRDRARRPGDPAARLDADRGRRPAARAGPPRGDGREVEALVERWRDGPFGRRRGRRASPSAARPVFHVRAWDPPGRRSRAPADRVAGRAVVGTPAHAPRPARALLVLVDGGYAVTGPVLALAAARLLRDGPPQGPRPPPGRSAPGGRRSSARSAGRRCGSHRSLREVDVAGSVQGADLERVRLGPPPPADRGD